MPHHSHRQAWDTVTSRHDALRTIINPETSMQRALREVPLWRIPVYLSDDARRLDYVGDETHRLCDPSTYPAAFEMSAVKGSEHTDLHIHTYALFLDAWGYGVVWNEVWAVYHGVKLPPPPTALFRDAAIHDVARPHPSDDTFWNERLPSVGLPPALPLSGRACQAFSLLAQSKEITPNCAASAGSNQPE